MGRLRWVTLVVALVAAAALFAAPVLYGQGGGGGGGTRGAGVTPGGGMGMMDPERMQAMAERIGLNEKEQAAVQKSIEAKFKARQALQTELDKLREVAFGGQSAEQQLTQAVAQYTKAMAKYRQALQAEDTALSGQLSLRSRSRCLTEGVLENELGMRMGRRTGGGGGGGGRGPGGPPQP